MDAILSPVSSVEEDEDVMAGEEAAAPQQPWPSQMPCQDDSADSTEGGRAPGDVADYIVPQPLHTTAIIPAPTNTHNNTKPNPRSVSSTALSQSALPASSDASKALHRISLRDPSVVRARKYVSYWRDPSDAMSPGTKFGKFGEDDGPPRIVSEELKKQLNSADYAYGSPYRASTTARRRALETENAQRQAALEAARFEAAARILALAQAQEQEQQVAPPPPPPMPVSTTSLSDSEEDGEEETKHAGNPSTPKIVTTISVEKDDDDNDDNEDSNPPSAAPPSPGHALRSPKPPRAPARNKPTVSTAVPTTVVAAATATSTSSSTATSPSVQADVQRALAALEKADKELATRSVAQRRRSSVSTLRSRRSSVSSGGGGRSTASKFKRRLSVDPNSLPQEDDPVDVFKLFAPEDIAFSPPAAARARAEAMKLLATERRAKRDALAELEAVKGELVSVKKQAKKDASQRAHFERSLREGRESAETRQKDAEATRDALKADLESVRRGLDSTLAALREEKTQCRELTTRGKAQADAAATAQAALKQELEDTASKLGPLEAGKDMYEKRWRDAESRIIDADRRARVAQDQSAEAELKAREAQRGMEKATEAAQAAELDQKVVTEQLRAANEQKRMLEKQILELDGKVSRASEVTSRVEKAQHQTEDKLQSTLEALDQTRAALAQMEAALDLERRRGQSLEEEIVDLNSSKSSTSQVQAREVADLKLRLETEQLGRLRAEKARTTAEFRQKLETERANELEGERSKLEDTIQELQSNVAALRRQLNETEGNLGMTVKTLQQERESSSLIKTQVVKEKSLREDVTFARRASVVSVADSRSSVETECELAVAKAAKDAAEGRMESVEQRARTAEHRLEQVLRERRALQNERSELAAQVANLEEQLLSVKRSEVSMTEMEQALQDAETNAADAKADLMDRIRDMEQRTPNPDAVRELVERERQARLAAEKLAQEERAARRRAEATWTRAERELRLSLAEMSDSQNRADRRYQNAKEELQRVRDGRSRSPVHRRPRSMSMVSGASAVSRGRSGSPVRRLRSPAASSVRSGIASIGAAGGGAGAGAGNGLVLESRTAEDPEFSHLVAAMQSGGDGPSRGRGKTSSFRRRQTRSRSRGATSSSSSSSHHRHNHPHHNHHNHHYTDPTTSSRSRSKSPAAHRRPSGGLRTRHSGARFHSRPVSSSPRKRNTKKNPNLVSSAVQLFGYHSRCMHPHGG